MSAPVKPGKKPAKRRPPATQDAPPADVGTEGALSDEDLALLATDTEDTGDDGGVRPVVIGKRGRRGDRPIEMITIFELDGKSYTVPKEPSPALVLKYILDLSDSSRALAVQSMAVTLLGRENFAALAASPEVEEDDVKDVFRNIGAVFFGSQTYRSIVESEGN